MSSPPRILLILGPSASGKTTASQALAREGWLHVEASHVLRRLLEQLSIEAADKLQAAEQLFEQAGFDAVARTILADLDAKPAEQVVISGLRTPEEMLALLEAPFSLRVMVLRAGFSTRAQRTEEDAAALAARDRRESGWGLLPIAEDLADWILASEGSAAELVTEVRQLCRDSNWSHEATRIPPELGRRRYRALTHLQSSSGPAPDSDLIDLAEARGLANRGPGGAWTCSHLGQLYLELMQLRWRDALDAP